MRALIAIGISSTLLMGCATHTKEMLIGGIVGSAVGAGVGYTVVHHGNDKQYEVRNTIITSAVFGLVTMGLMAYHYNALDEQKIELTSKLTRPALLENVVGNGEPVTSSLLQNEVVVGQEAIGRSSLKLDDQTRWIYPTFRKRDLKPEATGNELLSSRYIWEIVKPGFFITREQRPDQFTSEESAPIQSNTPEGAEKVMKEQ